MRDVFIFGAGAVLTALAVKYGNVPWLWDGTIYLGTFLMAVAVMDAAIRKLAKYKKAKMLSVLGMIIFGVGFLSCATWYFWPAPQATQKNSVSGLSPDSANLALYGTYFERRTEDAPGGNFSLRIQYHNVGKMPAYTPVRSTTIRLSTDRLPVDNTNAIMNQLVQQAIAEPYSTKEINQISLGNVGTVDSSLETVSPDQMNLIRAGKLRIYVFSALKYKDDLTPDGYVIISEFCTSTTGNIAELEYCPGGHNRRYLQKIGSP